ncbi:MAG: hypothetical protein UZ15_CFX003001614 [Chloroflexi bacterium OLB15]|nr:MAG: hypothetical protein UZ15_CFX003001614 [Chloroflexi bacterium OLB15]
MFAPGLIRWQQAFLNEYLHYFYHRDEALAALLRKPETRGEQTMRLTGALLEKLRALKGDPEASLAAYHEVMGERERTYMAHARTEGEINPTAAEPDDEAMPASRWVV